MTIKIEFPADREDIAMAFSEALAKAFRARVVTVAAENPKPATSAPSADGSAEQSPANTTTLTETQSTTTSSQSAAPTVDEKGVAFNVEFCSKAAIPFYASGSRKGQWKKRQGVDQDAYDQWYADELHAGNIEDATFDAGAAFGAQTTTPASDVPQDLGGLMKWVSEQQAAGNISAQDVNNAYGETGVTMQQVTNADTQAMALAALYANLSAKAKG